MNVPMDGFLVIDKRCGETSFSAVARVRRVLAVKKAGHAGTLDPLATGVLVVGLGYATRLLRFVESFEKEYTGVLRFGSETETDDADGPVTITRPVPSLSVGDIEAALCSFKGPIQQVPPIYAAVKVNGERAYTRARRGEAFSLTPRTVHVRELALVEWRPVEAELSLRVVCSRGTYIRALARDLGRVLGCGAHMRSLCRRRIGPFRLEQALALETADAETLRQSLLPMRSALAGVTTLCVAPEDVRLLLLGNSVTVADEAAGSGERLVLDAADEPVCIGQLEERSGGRLLRPLRLLKQI
ncbi:MAG: tRNA pseudouridine(55) synthase TruB [Fibrobacterota bacterium]